MTVHPSYPGLYIEELPSSSHAIMPAPTSIAAFVGYVHPYKNPGFAANGLTPVVELFSFHDYETNFGGLFASEVTDPALARAVYQFFLNGGSTAYVCGLQPGYKSAGTITRLGGTNAPTASIATNDGNIAFTAREPTDVVPMQIHANNVRASISSPTTLTEFDLQITYGSRIETYRGLSLSASAAEIADIIAKINAASSLVTIDPAVAWGTVFASANVPEAKPLLPAAAITATETFFPADFLPAFAVNGPLDNVETFNLLLVPGVADSMVLNAAMAFAERKLAFAIVDPPPQAPAFGTGSPIPIHDWMTGTAIPRSQNAALYFPYLNSTDPITGLPTPIAPSGFVAGIYARTDASRGVWKAPAGFAATVTNTTGPVATGLMNDPQQGVLNDDAVNCLRAFAGIGTVVWGARTLVGNNPAFAQSKYVPVRRMTLFIEQTLLANLKWVVFEPNDEPLWAAIRSSIEGFMLSLFKQGALQGASPSQAFQVKCDASTTTSDDQQNGIVNIVVAFAPLKPAEFVIIQIAQLAGQAPS
jgi:phage tail sheath protein FI